MLNLCPVSYFLIKILPFVLKIFSVNKKSPISRTYLTYGADEGNRTPVSTLARLCSTIKLHLHGGLDGTRTHDLLRDREAC